MQETDLTKAETYNMEFEFYSEPKGKLLWHFKRLTEEICNLRILPWLHHRYLYIISPNLRAVVAPEIWREARKNVGDTPQLSKGERMVVWTMDK